MTPQRTADAIAFQTSGLLTSSSVTFATQAEAEAGTDDESFMNPLRTAQAIEEIAPKAFDDSILIEGSDGDSDWVLDETEGP